MAGEVQDVGYDDPARRSKRQKLTNGVERRKSTQGSRLFAPYRTVGLISPTAVPFTAIPLGKKTFQITTSVGRSLQTYDLRRGLNLVFITRPQTPELVTASVAWKDSILAAWGGDGEDAHRGLWVFKRGKKETELEIPTGCKENVKSICVFGSWIVGVCETRMLVWKTDTFELYTVLQGFSPVHFTNCISNLPTFLNKIIVGRQDGSAEIWNVSSGKLVYAILPPSSTYGAVTAMEPTPALSLVAIAYENGPILIHDVRSDQVLMQLNTPAGAPVTSITFRADGIGAGDDGKSPGVMATASRTSGDVTLWDLNEGGRKTGVLREAHAHPTPHTNGGVSKVEFLPGQAVLVSSGLDNGLKTWIFDHTSFSPLPRHLHSRSGHGASITTLHFLPSASDGSDDSGKWLMSGSKDQCLWAWSLRRDGQSTELSQGGVQKKAKKKGLLSAGSSNSLSDLKCPPVTSIACSLNRDGGIGAIPGKHDIWQGAKSKKKKVDAETSAMTGWESVITAHQNSNKARTWLWGRKRAGRWAFETSDNGHVTAVAISPCGTFAVVGSDRGGIDMFNMQSGIHRQRFPARLTSLQAKQLKIDLIQHGFSEEKDEGQVKFLRGQGKHGSAVVGLAIDSLNKTVISAGADGKVKFWNFATGLLRNQIDWAVYTGIMAMQHHRGSDLAAFTCSDGCIRVVDVSTSKLIRELWASRPPPAALQGSSFTSFTFSNDGHWIAACINQIVLLWDLPTGHLVDAFKLKARCTSLAFSPTSEFFATATEDSVGVDIWSNRSVYTSVPVRHITSQELMNVIEGDWQAPTAAGDGIDALVTSGASPPEMDMNQLALERPDTEADLNRISSDLLSLSLVPRAKWQNLLYLDLIRQRNKPIEPPKKPEKAPFFLPPLPSQQQPRNTGLAEATSSNSTEQQNRSTESSRFLSYSAGGVRSTFTDLLHTATTQGDFAPLIQHFKTLNPAAADIEIRSLSLSTPDNGPGQESEMSSFVHALTWLMAQRRDFEMGQAWMAVFLKIHGDVVVSDAGVRSAVEKWKNALDEERSRVQRVAGYCGGLVGYLRAARV